MRPAQVIRILEREFASTVDGDHTPVMLWGPPGIGKSDIVRAVAARSDAPVVDLRLSQLEPSDLRGIPFRNGASVDWAVPSTLPDAERHGPRGVLFLDEINAAPPTVSAAAYQLILDRRLGEYRVPEGWAIFAAGNRQGDRGVTYAMPSPLANRFTHLELEPHLDDWVGWAFDHGIDPQLIGFLRFRPDLLFDFDPSTSQAAFPSPRSWEFAHRALRKFADDADLLPAALQSCVGAAAGIELAAYLEHLHRLPDIDAIADGTCDDVPDGIDLQYAVASALVRRALQARDGGAAARRTWGHILAYASRLPQRELGVMLVADLHRALGQPICEVPEFADWAGQVADVLLAG